MNITRIRVKYVLIVFSLVFAAAFLLCSCSFFGIWNQSPVKPEPTGTDLREFLPRPGAVESDGKELFAIPEFAEDREKEFRPGPETIEVCGKDFPADTKVLAFSGDEIDGFDEVLAKLRCFNSLEAVDFGSLSIEADGSEKIIEKFGCLDVKLHTHVSMCGKEFDADLSDIDCRKLEPRYLPDLLEKLKFFKELESVDLHGTGITPDQQRELVDAYPDVRFLWDVDILGEKYDSATEDLDLSNNRRLTFDVLREAIPLFCDLKRLDLSDCGFRNEELGEFREEFPDTKIVWRLYMGKWSLKTDAVAFSVLIYNYNYTALRSPDIEVLKYCTDLQALDLGHQKLTDLSVIGDYLPELRILILADNTVSDLKPLSKLKHLHYLELFVNPYLSDLSPLAECKEMVDLNISHIYNVSDISDLLDFPILERLWVEHTAVSAADIRLLKDTYPNATVIDQGWGSVDQGWRTHPRYFAMIDMYHKTDYISEEFSKYDSND